MHRDGSIHESRPEQQQIKLFGTEWYHGVRFKDIYAHLSTTAVTPLLYCSITKCHGWIASWVSLRYYVLLHCCSTAVLLLYRVVSGYRCRFVPVVCPHGFVGSSFSFFPVIPAPRWHSSAYH